MNFKNLSLTTAVVAQTFLFLASSANAQNGAAIYQQVPMQSQACYCEANQNPGFQTTRFQSQDFRPSGGQLPQYQKPIVNQRFNQPSGAQQFGMENRMINSNAMTQFSQNSSAGQNRQPGRRLLRTAAVGGLAYLQIREEFGRQMRASLGLR